MKPLALSRKCYRWLCCLAFAFSLAPLSAFSTEKNISVVVTEANGGFVIDGNIEAAASLPVVWGVLIDFDHMASFVQNLKLSKVVKRDGNLLVVKQEGVAKYGLFSFAFNSEREIRLDPMKHIYAKNISGTLKRMESTATLMPLENKPVVQVKYHAEVVPDSVLARVFGASFVRHEFEEQWHLMVAEMLRREAAAKAAEKSVDKSIDKAAEKAGAKPVAPGLAVPVQ